LIHCDCCGIEEKGEESRGTRYLIEFSSHGYTTIENLDAATHKMAHATRRVRANAKRQRNGAGTRNEEEETAVVDDRSMPPLETPRVLTRGLVNGLTHGLDASDVLECYALVRSAPLHGIANSTITVQKMAIGIRFRPKVADVQNPYYVKTPMELTLEYGPARLGPLLSDEATPIVQGEEELYSYLAWDNNAKVYFTQKIVTEQFLSSHYMASMTGAVLNKLLYEAVEYTEKRKFYQPFSVFSDSGRLLLRSSSSSDFTWFVWSHLAHLGVEIEPILPPAMYEARLYTKTVTKVFPDQEVTRAAASFYHKLYNCLESMATNNYGSFLASKAQPAVDDDSGDDDVISSTGTVWPNAKNGGNRDLGVESVHFEEEESNFKDVIIRRLEEDSQETEAADDIKTEVPSIEDDGTFEDEKDVEVKNSEVRDEPTTIAGQGEETVDNQGSEATIVPEDDFQLASNSSHTMSDQLSIGPTESPTSFASETYIPTAGIQDVEKAQNAADDAQKAADEAKIAAKTEGGNKAAYAAQAAADAAAAAADATSSAASQAAMDSLLSGDGAMMSSIVSTCFSNPRYEITSPDANRTAPTEIYLFRDPSTYFKLELTSPFLEVTKLNKPLPNAATISSVYGTGGDALDWSLAISIFLSLLLGILLICQQMGKRYVACIFKCQRSFFNPRNHDNEEDAVSGVQSGSHFFFGKSGIPVSMGGQQSSYSPLTNGKTLQNVIVAESFMEDDPDGADLLSPNLQPKHHRRLSSSRELEMVNFGSDALSPAPLRSPTYKDKNSDSSSDSSEDGEIAIEIPDRLLRDPDLVELHCLKSKSKVAIPVGSSANGNAPYSNSSSFAEGSVTGMNPDQMSF
jgi:hypothetical protein